MSYPPLTLLTDTMSTTITHFYGLDLFFLISRSASTIGIHEIMNLTQHLSMV